MASAPNVIGLFGPPNQRAYRAAVAKCIRELKSRHNLNNVSLGEHLGCSDQTIVNAENEETDLNAVTLLRAAYAFGESAIAPVRALYLCEQSTPLSLSDRFDELQAHLNGIRKEVSA